MTINKLKEELLNQCQAFVDIRLKTFQKNRESIQESLLSETKSSAGDKHETGRAMLQLGLEKMSKALTETQNRQQVLDKIDITKNNSRVVLGSVVYTSTHNYFIAISCGELQFEDESFYAVSIQTPIGKELLGKEIGDSISFRNERIEILQVI